MVYWVTGLGPGLQDYRVARLRQSKTMGGRGRFTMAINHGVPWVPWVPVAVAHGQGLWPSPHRGRPSLMAVARGRGPWPWSVAVGRGRRRTVADRGLVRAGSSSGAGLRGKPNLPGAGLSQNVRFRAEGRFIQGPVLKQGPVYRQKGSVQGQFCFKHPNPEKIMEKPSLLATEHAKKATSHLLLCWRLVHLVHRAEERNPCIGCIY